MELNPARDVWTGMLLMGKTYTPMEVIFDTTSDWLCVEGFDCESCKGNTFNSDYSGQKISNDFEKRVYGSISLIGYEYKDQVCLIYENCLSNFHYMSITDWGQNEPVDGIVGLARNSKYYQAARDPNNEEGYFFID